jgi:hypothetical protein
MTTTVRRDPFARGEYRRESIGHGECTWCGTEKRVFTYEWEADASCFRHPPFGRTPKGFCDLGCFDAYNG